MEIKKTKLAIVIPCLNEQESLLVTVERLNQVIDELVCQNIIDKSSFIYMVDDGSSDNTWQIINTFHKQNPQRFKGLKFTRNFGNQNAILAGLEASRKLDINCAITIDADLQQDETKIREFILKFQNGAQIVCGIRNNRKTDSLCKKASSLIFYKMMNLLGVNIPINHSEYRLISKHAIDIISQYSETNIFLRGLFYSLGLKTDYVYFDVKKRFFGKSKYDVISLSRLAACGVVSFTLRPLKLVTILGFTISLLSFFVGLSALYHKFILNEPVFQLYEIFETFFSGVEIICIGIIGEYVGQILQEVKARPRYIEDERLD